MYNVYLIKTDIKVKANTFLNINILAEGDENYEG